MIPSSGTGPLSAQVSVAPYGRVTFTQHAQIDPSFDETFDIDNVATLDPGPNTQCNPADSSQACDANATVHVTIPAELVAATPPAQTTTPTETTAPAELPVTGATPLTLLKTSVALITCGSLLLVWVAGHGARDLEKGTRHDRYR